MLSPDSLLPMRELLRSRHELPALEVTRLVRSLPETLDDSESGSGGALINDAIVCFEAPPPGGLVEAAKTPVPKWPAFRLLIEGTENQDAGSTIVGGISLFDASPQARLAALMYELLGGRIRNEQLMRGKFSPLAEVSEEANAVLKKALSPRGFPDCRHFWKAWIEVIQPEGEPAPEVPLRPWEIPEPLLGQGQPGEVLELTPTDRPAVPSRLVARATFRIGRSRRLSDLPTRSATSGVSGEAIKELSRIHVLGERLGAGIGFRDGNGERPSANGSAWNQQGLTAKAPVPVQEPGMLLLSPTSCRYRLEVVPFAHHRLLDTEIANLAAWSGAVLAPMGPPARFGALVFRHPRGALVVRQTVWLLAGLGAEIFPSGEFAWSDEDTASLTFVHRHGCFWLANESLQEAILINETPLAPGQIAPLTPGQPLQVGGVGFQLNIS